MWQAHATGYMRQDLRHSLDMCAAEESANDPIFLLKQEVTARTVLYFYNKYERRQHCFFLSYFSLRPLPPPLTLPQRKGTHWSREVVLVESTTKRRRHDGAFSTDDCDVRATSSFHVSAFACALRGARASVWVWVITHKYYMMIQ